MENIVQSVVPDKDDPDTKDEHAQEIADACLDRAIASKTSERINDCIEAHVQRMRVVPHYKTTDAIRLLGIDEDSEAVVGDDDHGRARIAESSCKGLLEIHDNHRRNATTKFTPSRKAANLGNRVKEFFFREDTDCKLVNPFFFLTYKTGRGYNKYERETHFQRTEFLTTSPRSLPCQKNEMRFFDSE